ncbi:MAG: Recombination inhibitory protein MutS2 [Candidatus Bipolaricaulis sibiricus]|uniref:Endonuclease MutS2 n=1 Tax=Bipolaricaulis sibiricus TaxID=2501609 RepID=A0A410FRZ4_BIPS1|nr:MAG: Recombination inhibitory protein MutS2 [Candidatus Bipolaricaulis sibiricus]
MVSSGPDGVPVEVVNLRTARDLELGKVLAGVAGFAASSLGAEAVRALVPRADREALEREYALVAEMEQALQDGFAMGGIHDLAPLLDEAREHGTLASDRFVTVAATLTALSEIRQGLSSSRLPGLKALGEKVSDQADLLRAIWRAVDERGEIRDDATPKLADLNRELRALTDRITDLLRRYLDRNRDLVQDPVITQRGGRFVVPFKAGARGASIVVHETSASGQTLFAEPASVVELNNRLRETAEDIRRERIRILAELTARLLAAEAPLRRDLALLARLDGLYARARYGQAVRGALPTLVEDGRIELVDARHPLLGERAVPVSIAFGGAKRVAVITGPNTGGKTVLLKTIGLLTVMSQCGIPIPASTRTVLSVFPKVRSDIGEEQSIEQSLSTFSSHMTNIVAILRDADDRTLVLLDELGAGTDPQEGAALGLAILERLLELGATAAVATHLTPLKHFSVSHPGVLSCSMEFDLETLSPTYRVQEGVPGRSCALEIARRLGLPEELIERARASFTSGEIRAEEIIAELERERGAARRMRANLELERETVARLRADYEKRLLALKEKKAEALGQELARLEGEVRAVRKELSELIAQARAAESAEERRGILRRVEEVAAEVPAGPSPIRRPVAIGEGMTVRVRSTGKVGTVRWVEGDRVGVEVRGRRIELPAEALEPAEEQPLPRTAAPTLGPVSEVSLELSVRGLTVAEAEREVTIWLDRLLRAGVSTGRLVHGKGTGALREALHTYLRHAPYVKRFYLAPPAEGGDGVTIVELE